MPKQQPEKGQVLVIAPGHAAYQLTSTQLFEHLRESNVCCTHDWAAASSWAGQMRIDVVVLCPKAYDKTQVTERLIGRIAEACPEAAIIVFATNDHLYSHRQVKTSIRQPNIKALASEARPFLANSAA
jgi:hypothetical protein